MDLIVAPHQKLARPKPCWKELKNQRFEEYYEGKPGDPIPERLEDRIPLWHPGDFMYQIDTSLMRVTYFSQINHTFVLGANQGFLIRFDKSKMNPDREYENPCADDFSFQYLTDSKIRINISPVVHDCRFDREEMRVGVESQNCGLYRDVERRGFPNQWTDRGRAFMEEFIRRRNDFLLLEGLPPTIRQFMDSSFKKVESAYREDKIEPQSWFYT